MNPADFVGSLERLTRVYQNARKFALDVTGLSSEQLSVLSEAGRRPGSPIETIAAALSMTASTTGKVVHGLIKKGLLSDSDSGIEPTPKGAKVGSVATEQVWAAFAQALGGAATVATAVAGLISTMASIMDRWMERTLPEPTPKPKTRKKK